MKALLRNLLFATSLVAASTCIVHAQVNTSSDSETAVANTKMDIDDNPVLKKYSWVKNIVNPRDCKGESVSLYHHAPSRTSYIIIDAEISRTVYNEEGLVHCKDSKTLDCAKYYELTKQEELWSYSKSK